MAFQLPELAFALDALEPHIDAKTMEIHHGKHHAAYTNNLNAAIAGTDLAGKTIEEILSGVSKLSPAIRNNGGGFWNHNLFWEILTPGGDDLAPNSNLAAAIDRDLGGFEQFKKDFSAAATTRFGSGWAWLCVDADDKLFLASSPNQDNPLMDLADKKGQPILGLDVWEHAYYLNYQNRRPDYINAFFSVINWKAVQDKFNAASKSN